MLTRLLNLWGSLRDSFWFVPSFMVFLAVVLSMIMLAIDRRGGLEVYPIFNFLYAGGLEGARSVLSTIASSMITVAGVVFSITMVVLTLASSQFGSRLLKNFMHDMGNQVVLGTFISTYIYCLLVLQTVHAEEEEIFVPAVSVTFAIALALINIGVIIYFIHHVSTSIQASHVIANVHVELEKTLQRLFPSELGGEYRKLEHNNINDQYKEKYQHTIKIQARDSGYLQAIAGNDLLEIAAKNNLLIELQYRPGEFIVKKNILAIVRSEEECNEEITNTIASLFFVGDQRTPEQDPEYAIHQLVEIAVRALSPGINDPYTAMTCIDRLGSSLCSLTRKDFPSPYRFDEKRVLRIIAKTVNFTGITNAAFDQIRQNSRSNVAVIIRMLEMLQKVAVQALHPEQRQAVLRQANMIERAARESLLEKNDWEDVDQRYLTLLNSLNGKKSYNET